jgi:HPt (histidine-containing phosphotransfer) domain-containing protein
VLNTATSENSFRSPLVDDARLAQLEDIARDRVFLGELIQGFINDVESIVASARKAVVSKDYKVIPDLMHSLKGAAVSVGALRLAELSGEVDDAASEGNITKMMTALEAASTCVIATSDYLARFASSGTNAAPSRTMH